MGRVAIVGAGAWGTALACVVRRAGNEAVIWAREPEVADAINVNHANPLFLPDIALDPAISAVSDFAQLGAADAVLLVVPAQFVRATLPGLLPMLAATTPLVLCAKGIEATTGLMMTEVLREAGGGGRPIAVLSGPTFAAEVARGLPTAVTLACGPAVDGEALVALLGGERFRPYLSDDVTGAEIGGAVKNVLAIACGIAHGRGFGDNARAALITRGLAEMTRLCLAKGGKAETMMGLSGIGDLTLTCTAMQSRNYSLGFALGEGKALAEVMGGRLSVAEGAFSAPAVATLAARHKVDMPICEEVDAILAGRTDIDRAIGALLSRPFKAEAV